MATEKSERIAQKLKIVARILLLKSGQLSVTVGSEMRDGCEMF